MRKRLWGTEQPSGQDDPHAHETAEEREDRLEEEREEALAQREQQEIRSLGANPEVEPLETQELDDEQVDEDIEDLPQGYRPASTWRRLRNISDPEVTRAISGHAFNA